ncbi:MAG: endo alpha-1,4 polygalactosaminidase [Planctomycetota bacterium]
MACRSVEQGTGETQAAAVEAEPKTPPRGIANRLVDVRCWAVQLQGLDRPGARAALTACRFDLLVIEPMVSVRGQESFPIAEFVRELHGTRGTAAAAKRVLAYVNVGQAEAYRSYWKDDWVVPGEDHAGEPDFLLAADPEGWQGNYPVAWWDARWQEVLFGTPASLIDQALAAGFDGLFLDWVLGFEEPAVAAAARAQGLQPAQAMADLLARLRVYARERDPEFLLVAQNAGYLFAQVPEVAEAIDAVSHEDLSFRGRAVSQWDHPEAGGLPVPAAERESLSHLLLALGQRGVVLLTLDYALTPADRDVAIANSRRIGAIPCVSRTALNQLPEWPAAVFATPPAGPR